MRRAVYNLSRQTMLNSYEYPSFELRVLTNLGSDLSSGFYRFESAARAIGSF